MSSPPRTSRLIETPFATRSNAFEVLPLVAEVQSLRIVFDQLLIIFGVHMAPRTAQQLQPIGSTWIWSRGKEIWPGEN